MADIYRVNNRLVAWSSYVLTFNGLRYQSFSEVNYGDKLEFAQGYGQSSSHRPIARTPGKYVPDPLKFKFFQHGSTQLIQDIASWSPDGSLGSAIFPIVLQYYEVGLPAHILEFLDCSFVTMTETVSESAEAMMDEIEFSTQGILRDGIALFRPDLVM